MASASSSSLSCLRTDVLIASGVGEDDDCVVVLGDEPGPGVGVDVRAAARASVVGVSTGTDAGKDDSGEGADDSGAGGAWASTASGGGVMVVGVAGVFLAGAAPHVHFSMNCHAG